MTVIGCFYFSSEESPDIVAFSRGSCLIELQGSAFSQSALREFHIRRSVRIIGKSCFTQCHRLSCVVFKSESQLKVLEDCFFTGSGLQNFHIPTSVDSIGFACFRRYEFLDVVEINSESRLAHLCGSAFAECALKCVELQPSVESIGNGWLGGCTILMNVWFEPGLRSIGESSFTRSAIHEVIIPASVSTIGK
jgi:hypothetical protein